MKKHNKVDIKSNLYVESSLSVLHQVKLISNHYLNSEDDSKEEILLSIYGILQTCLLYTSLLMVIMRKKHLNSQF